ncbi:hypothetical protein [Aliarcobacter butzleri]|uniref:hypothetical protein n=1 Tax=Aliarcobacter butzleri TaxID=28197 RepID=UPI0021B23D21|nr:hypothetical protein [Aliarcobacter butzleri]MCT7557621.1 hypothetical protein [Aliarcobacter butzleri]
MDIGLVSSVNSTSEVKSVKNTAYSQQTSKVDYSNYSIADLRKVSYEEAKGNFDAIMNRASELSIDDKSVKESAGVIAQLESTRVSDNNTFNKSLYESVQNIEDGGAAWYANFEIMENLKEYASGTQDVKPSWMITEGTASTEKKLTKSQINSIDFSDFISKMVSGFSSQLADAPKNDDTLKKQYQNIVDSYSTLQKSYENEVRKPYYA